METFSRRPCKNIRKLYPTNGKKSYRMIVIFSSQHRPSAEGAAKILKHACHKWGKKSYSMLNLFSFKSRLSAEGAAKILKHLSTQGKNFGMFVFFSI
jgi:hypothetical protein